MPFTPRPALTNERIGELVTFVKGTDKMQVQQDEAMTILENWLTDTAVFPLEVINVRRGGAHGKRTAVRKHSRMDLVVTIRGLKCDKPGGWRPGMLDFIAEYMAVSLDSHLLTGPVNVEEYAVTLEINGFPARVILLPEDPDAKLMETDPSWDLFAAPERVINVFQKVPQELLDVAQLIRYWLYSNPDMAKGETPPAHSIDLVVASLKPEKTEFVLGAAPLDRLEMLRKTFTMLASPQTLNVAQYKITNMITYTSDMPRAARAQRPFILDPANPSRNAAKGLPWKAIQRTAQKHLDEDFRNFLAEVVFTNDMDPDEQATSANKELSKTFVEMGISLQKKSGEGSSGTDDARNRKALEFFKEALVADPNNGDALIRCGVLLMNLGEHTEAEPLLKQASELPGPEQEVAKRAYQAMETRKKWSKGRSKLRAAAAFGRTFGGGSDGANAFLGAGRPVTAPADTLEEGGLGETQSETELESAKEHPTPQRPVSAFPPRIEEEPEMSDDELQREIQLVKQELYKTKAEVLEAYAAAASIEASHIGFVGELQAEVQNNRDEAAELMKAVSPDALNAELMTLIESGQLLPVDEAFDRGYARPDSSQSNFRPDLRPGSSQSNFRPNTPARQPSC